MKDLEQELKTLQFKYDLLKKVQEENFSLLKNSLEDKTAQILLAEDTLMECWAKEKDLLQELKEALLELKIWKTHAHTQKPNEDKMMEMVKHYIKLNEELEEKLSRIPPAKDF